MNYPYKFQKTTDEEQKIIEDIYKITDFVHVNPSESICVKRMEKYGPDIYNFEPRKDDFWLVGFPRSGTTLLQEIIYLIGTNLDYETASARIMDERFPFLEQVLIRSNEEEELYDQLCRNKKILTEEEERVIPQFLKLTKLEGVRFIKSHLGFNFLNPKLLNVGCKVVFIARNPKDTLLSFYKFPDLVKHDAPEAEGLYKVWLAWSKNITFGSGYFEMLKEAWARKNNENLLFLFYEDLNTDKRNYLKKISEFLGKKLTEDEVEQLAEHTDINNFKKNKSLNNEHLIKSGLYVKSDTYSFIGKGENGRWREKFTREFNEIMNKWITENLRRIPNFEMPKCWEEVMDLKL